MLDVDRLLFYLSQEHYLEKAEYITQKISVIK